MPRLEKSKVTRARRMMGVFLTLWNGHASLDRLAGKYGMNERSILRDLKLLREAGAILRKDRRGYFISKVRP